MPYRTLPPKPNEERDWRDADLLLPFAVVWVTAIVHLVFAIGRAEPWGAGTTLTAILAIWIPWALRATIRARLR